MITLVNLKESINNLLKPTGYKIYGNEIKKGFIRPSFFVQILPIGGTDLYKSDLFENNYLVEINYFSKEQTDFDNYKMADTIKENLFPYFKINDRKLIPKELRSEINDGVLSTKFNLSWFDYIAKEDKAEKVQNINIRMEE